MSSVIHLESVKFSYDDRTKIVDIDQFQVAPQEHVFLHGPSGSGKSTLLSLLSGILSPQQGSVKILGTPLESLTLRQRDAFRGCNIGYIFQMFNLIPHLNVRENILLPLKMNKVKRSQVQNPEEEMRNLLQRLKIPQLEFKKPSQLSIGQQQRVAAARSLIGKPKLIIADEPTSALDVDSRASFMKLLFQTAGHHEATILFVSHDHTLAPHFPRTVPWNQINQRR